MALIKMEKLNVLEKIESLIKAGQIQLARAQLLKTKSSQISPIDLVLFCSLLRRAGLSVEVLKILQPLVYPKARSAVVATVEEKLEYASNLVRIGVLNEAERILNSIDAQKYPDVFIRRGFLVISRWDYDAANRFFRQYLEHPQAEAYSVLIAQVNILQGLVNLKKTEEAWALAQELLNKLDPIQNKLLLAAVYEFCSEIFRLKKDQQRALEYIRLGKTLLIGTNTIDEFLLRKQEQIVLQNKDAFDLLRAEAVERKHYESIRDLDFQKALLTKDERLLNQVHWKTMSKSYKERILSQAHEKGLQLNREIFQFKKNKGMVFDLESHSLDGTTVFLKKDKAEARLFAALLSEGYKPIKIFDLFALVYPDEIFFPLFSSDKMHQLIKRLRHFIAKAKLPLKILCQNEEYKVEVTGNFSLSFGKIFRSEWERKWKTSIGSKYFSISEAQNFWGCSLRTTLRRLDEIKKAGRFQTKGKTRATRYRFI